MTNESREQLLAEHVRALATVILTRREDLTITETKRDTGIDFHVRIEREDKPMRLTFGVLLRGVVAPTTAEDARQILVPTLGQFQGMRKFTYPVCLFFFTLRQEQAYFCWLAQPIVHEGAPKLLHHNQANCVPLTNACLDQVIEDVVNWYDAVASVLIA